MDEHCSTGQNPQWAAVSMEEEEEEEEDDDEEEEEEEDEDEEEEEVLSVFILMCYSFNLQIYKDLQDPNFMSNSNI